MTRTSETASTAMPGTPYYGVRSTGIYCRTGCPSRRPRPENVVAFASVATAEQAGFRPCRRCRPNEVATRADPAADAVARACAMVATAAEPPRLADMAAAAGLSPHHFHRVFKAATGLTPRAYVAADKERRLREALSAGDSVTTAIHAAGYGSTSRVYEGTAGRLGMAPARYRAKGAGEHLRYATGPCALGAILIGVSGKGVCAIEIGEDEAGLVATFRARFADASIEPGGSELETLLVEAARAVEHPGLPSSLPLDVRGTLFQERVWQALRMIPPGMTKTYAELAAAIGRPEAVRAVAGACAANRHAVVIPCHRVVRTGGDLGGYRWGLARKRALLDRERGD